MARVFGDIELDYIQQVFESKRLGWVPDGMVSKLDEAFARFTGAQYGICRNSAMTGLAQAVAISGAGCGHEVICDPLVHFGGVAALSFNCVPKFVDVQYDTYLMDQNACSSPHLVVWLGNEKASSGVKSRFWEGVYEIAAAKYDLAPISAVDKLTMLCENAIELQEVSSVSRYENLLYVLELNQLPNNVEDIRGECGYFYEFSVKSLDEIAHIINEKYQTLTYYGIENDELVTFVLNHKLFGIDRIVPIGSAMDISIIWDGYDLVRTLSRICDVK